MKDALRLHWPEYLMEGAELGIFMISACVFGVILEYPGTPVHQAIADPFLRRALMGVAMGLTAISIVYSPWGKQSGAHFNPAVTLTFLRAGRVKPWDAVFYITAQFVGGILGVVLATAFLGDALGVPTVNYVNTVPGVGGAFPAFLGEFSISFILMCVVLIVSNHERVAAYTGIFAGSLVALYITFEAPISGMSMNPARSFASAIVPGLWEWLWIYFTAPPVAMLFASIVYTRFRGVTAVKCAKLHHQNTMRCIHCGANMEPVVQTS